MLKSLRYRLRLSLFIIFSLVVLILLYILHGIYYSNIQLSEKSHDIFEKVDIGLPERFFRPILVTDFSRSKYNSIIYINDENHSLRIYCYSPVNENYYSCYNITDIKYISHVMAVDLERKGYNDLIITHSANGKPPYFVSVVKNNKGILDSFLKRYDILTDTLPFAFDLDDKTTELLITDSSTKNLTRFVPDKYVKSLNFSFDTITAGEFNNKDMMLLGKSGDTVSVLFNYSLLYKFDIPPMSFNIYTADIDNDGYLDLVVPYIYNNKPGICVMFNEKGERFASDQTCSLTSRSYKIPNTNLNGYITGIQIADSSLNGLPDIIVNLNNNDNVESILFENMHGSRNLNEHDIIIAESNYYKITGGGNFFDFNYDGVLDIISSTGSYLSHRVKVPLYLYVSSLNTINLNQKSLPLSTVQNGGSIRITYTDKSGTKYNSLAPFKSTNDFELPYYIFGLPQNVHYIDEVSISSNKVANWTWILPQSRFYGNVKGQMRVFIGYSANMYPILFSALTIILILTGIDVYLAEKEEEEDKKEAAQMLPLF